MSHALYYPTIEFRDLGALKRSLLVWERVFRIVPTGYVPNDEPEVTAAVTEGVIVNLHVDSSEKGLAAQHFLDLYRRLDSPASPLVWPAGFSAPTFTRINPDKIDERLQPLFEQLALRMTSDGFLEVPSELAGGYMFYLANSVAAQRSLDLLSDSPDYWTVGTFFASAANFTEAVYDESAEAYLATLAVEDLLPKDLEGVSMDAVLRFRENHNQERTAFQKELHALREQVARCNSKQHAQYIVIDFVKQLQRARDDYRGAIGFLSRSHASTLLTVGLPVGLSILSLPAFAGGDPYSATRLATGLLFGAISSLASKALIPRERSAASFLISAEDLAAGPGLALHRRFEEFIND